MGKLRSKNIEVSKLLTVGELRSIGVSKLLTEGGLQSIRFSRLLIGGELLGFLVIRE